MKNLRKNLSHYLPLLIGIFVLLFASDAFASIKEWVVDKAGEVAAFAMGIDTTDNCVPPQGYSNCLFCPLFKVLYNAGSYVAGKSYVVFSSGLGQLVITFFAVTLALLILKNLASMNAKDPGNLLNDIFRKGFVCIVIFIIVSRDYYQVLNLTLIPIIRTGLFFTNTINETTTCAEAAGVAGFVTQAAATETAGLPLDVGTMVICAADNIEAKINSLFDHGRWAFCLGTGPHRLFHILPNPIFIVDGLFLYLGGIFFLVGYPWVIGDAILQLGIAMALLPFAVAGYAFSATKSYLKKVFEWILHSLFTFLFMAVLLTCVLDYIESIIRSATAIADPLELFMSPVSGLAFFGFNMLMIIFILVIGWSYMPMTKDLAGEFASGSGISPTGKFGSKLTNLVEDQANKIVDKAEDIAIDKSKRLIKSTTRGISRNSASLAVRMFGKTDATTGTRTLAFGGIASFSILKNADGSTALRKEWTSPIGRKHVTVSDKYMTIKTVYTASGRQIKNEVSFKKDFADKYLFNEDGSVINVQAFNVLMNSPLAQNNPAYKQAIMEQIAIRSLKAQGQDVGRYYRSRNVIFDPDNPNRIIVTQVDHTGKETRFSAEIDMATGQTAVGYIQKKDRNRWEQYHHDNIVDDKKVWRKSKIKLASMGMNFLNNKLNFGGGGEFNFLGAKYTVGTDTNGNAYYERKTKKYLFFGPEHTKTYSVDGTTQQKNFDKLAFQLSVGRKKMGRQLKIGLINNLIAFHGHKNADGSYTFRNWLGTKYHAKVDANGNPYFEKERTTRFSLDGPKFFNTYTYVDKYEVDGSTYMRDSVVIDKYDVDTVSRNPEVSTKLVDDPHTEHYKVYFNNGMTKIDVTGVRDASTGDIASEQVKFSYSAVAQKGHDSILAKYDDNQVVDSQGNISPRLTPQPKSKDPYDLTFGMGNLAGLTDINGIPTRDFIVNNVLAAGRRRRSNKFKSKIFGRLI